MTTLEQLHMNLSDTTEAAYFAARAEKVAEIAEYIADYLKPGIDAAKLAEELMTTAEDMGRIHGDEVNGEVRSAYTRDRNALPFTV